MKQDSGLVGSPIEDPEFGRGEITSRGIHPPVVTFVAAVQLFRAAAALCIGLMLWVLPDLHLDSVMGVKGLAYLATHHALPPRSIAPVVMLAFAAYFILTGYGLWCLQQWARKALLLTSGATVILWIKYFALDSLIRNTNLGASLGPSPIDKSALSLITAVILLDALIFCCLALYPEVGRAFGEKNE
jgi:hypothetical protein